MDDDRLKRHDLSEVSGRGSSRCCLLIRGRGTGGMITGWSGNWKTVSNRHLRWSGDETWEMILDRLRVGCDEAEGAAWTVAVDATVVRAHQHAAGARHAPPGDIDPARLAPAMLSAPARARS